MPGYGIEAVRINDYRHKGAGQYILHQVFHIWFTAKPRPQHHHICPVHLLLNHTLKLFPA